MDNNDFTIALVYDNRKKSVALKSVFERAFDLYKKKLFFAKRQLNMQAGNHIDDNAISSRFSSAHWARINSIEYADYVTFEDAKYPDVLMMSEG
jgi:hypothetical protein